MIINKPYLAGKPHITDLVINESTVGPRTVTLTIVCPFCKSTRSLTTYLDDFANWTNGQYAQDLFTPVTGEALMSGICSPCWDDLDDHSY